MERQRLNGMFESYVIFAGNKTAQICYQEPYPFESYVIFAGNKTERNTTILTELFESYVIFAGNKTCSI